MNKIEIEEYKDLFHGKGCLSDEYKIVIDNNVPPVVNAPRRVPFSLMEPLKEKLSQLESLDYLKKVSEPTKWVSSLVVVRKTNGKLRVCIDPTHLNKAILRHHYPTPSIDEITSK